MQGKIRHLLERDGRYFARLVIPKALRPFMAGKYELRTPLGADRRVAIRALPSAIVALQGQIRAAEVSAADAGHTATPVARLPSSALSPSKRLTGLVMVIPPFLTGCICRTYAAFFSFMAGVIPPKPMLGRSLL